MTKGLTDDQLKAMTDAEMRASVGYWGGKLEEMRRKNEYYFLGLAKGDLAPPEIEGRSNVVDTTVRNTVLGMQAPLIKTFCGSENVVEFSAMQEDDEEKAQQATDYINYLLRKQNPGYQIISTWITDALVQKVGILKVWWDNSVVETREEYRGQTDVQLALLLDDEEIEPVDQKSYPDEEAVEQRKPIVAQMEQRLQQLQQEVMQSEQGAQRLQQATQMYQEFMAQPPAMLYDVTVRRTKTGGRIRIENVPPEEFLISKKAKSIAESPFVGHRVMRTISDLTAMGYKNVDQINSDDSSSTFNAESIERKGFDDASPYLNQESTSLDPSQRIVWITECYMKADVDGDGIAEWRKIVRAGNQILENEECDGPPFVSICPTPLPHRFFGLCPADLAMEPQRIQTSLLRAQLDNVYLQVNGRYFAVEGQVNLDDLLTSRPGGVVRVKNPGAVGRLDQATADSGHAMELLQWFEAYTEEATGWTRQSQGGNGLQLNQTATQSNIVTNRADSRVEIISRQFAETGFTDLFKMILKLVCQHQDKAASVKLGNKWQNIDPREWTNQFDLTINVGLGTGNKDQQVQHLMALEQVQGRGLQLGITTPKNMYQSAKKLAEALGFKDGDQFFTDPDAPPDPNAPQKPQQPNPDMMKLQQADQQHQRELQQKAQQQDADRQHAAQLDQMKGQMQMQVDRNRQEAEAQQKQLEIQQQGQLEQLKEQYKQEQHARNDDLERWKAQLQSDTQIYIAQMNNQLAAQTAALSADRAQGEALNGN